MEALTVLRMLAPGALGLISVDKDAKKYLKEDRKFYKGIKVNELETKEKVDVRFSSKMKKIAKITNVM
ncbi:13164_t:CDS:2, partial [Dentiscutata erythropus]